jgi:hypothetical protein
MFLTVFLIEISNANLLFGFMPESVAVMLSGFCLVGVTVVLRRVLKRHDGEKAGVGFKESTKK